MVYCTFLAVVMGRPSKSFGSHGQGDPAPTTLFLEPLPSGPRGDPKVKLITAPAVITVRNHFPTTKSDFKNIPLGRPNPRMVKNIQEGPVVARVIPGLAVPPPTASQRARSTVRKGASTVVTTQVITVVISV